MSAKKSIDYIIKHNETVIFHNLVVNKGFEYALTEFLFVLYDLQEDIYQIRGYLFDEFKRIEFCSDEDFNNQNLINQIRQIKVSEEIPETLKVTIIYNIISRTSRNVNLNIKHKYILTEMINGLLDVYEKDNKANHTVISVFSLIFMHLMCFNSNNQISQILFEAVTVKLSTFPITISKNTHLSILKTILIMGWAYYSLDRSVGSKTKDNIYINLTRIVKIEFTDTEISLVHIISKNIERIVFDFFDEYIIDFSELINLEFYGNNYEAKYAVFTEKMISDLYAILISTNNIGFYRKDILFHFDNLSIQKQYIIIENFISKFDNSVNGVYYTEDFFKQINKMNQFLKLNKNIKPDVNDNLIKIFHQANRLAINLKNKGARKNTYIVGSETVLEKAFTEKKSVSIGTKSIDSNKYLAGYNNVDGVPKPLVVFNFGINDTKELSNNVFLNLLDSSFELEIIKGIIKKHLTEVKIKKEDDVVKTVIENLNKYNVDTISNINEIEYRLGTAYDTLKTHEVFQDLKVDKRNSGLEFVLYNSSKFMYEVLPLRIERHALNEDEVIDFMKNQLKVSMDMYKIRNLYYTFEEAIEIVKSDFRRDEVHVDYILLYEEIAGIIFNLDDYSY